MCRYAAFEVPSNLLLKRLRPSIWLPTIMVAWGIVMTLMGIVQNYHGLLIARIFLGVTEAGLFPGMFVILAAFHKPLTLRKALRTTSPCGIVAMKLNFGRRSSSVPRLSLVLSRAS